MILEKYDFASINEFLVEFALEVANKTNGKLHLTTILKDNESEKIGLAGTNEKHMLASLNFSLKQLLVNQINEGKNPDTNLIESILKADSSKINNDPAYKDIQKRREQNFKDGTDPLQEMLNKFMKKH